MGGSMRRLDLDGVREYVNENIGTFHQGRIDSLQNLDLILIEMNPYLLRAKNMLTAADIVDSFMEASLSSSDDERFGEFLEGLAVFVAQQTTGGYKSEQEGVDLEFVNGRRTLCSADKVRPELGKLFSTKSASKRFEGGGQSGSTAESGHGCSRCIGHLLWQNAD